MVSIVVSWRDRGELEHAAPSLCAAARAAGGEVVVVNLGGDGAWLRRQVEGVPAGVLRVLDVDRPGYFNKPVANNVGASAARFDTLFFCDCDIVLEPDTVPAVLGLLAERPGRFATLAGVRESELNSRGGNVVVCFGYELNIATRDGARVRIVDNEENALDGTRQAPGLLFVRRADFLAVDGYNSELDGWGWEDQDMICRLTLGRRLERVAHGVATHLSHDDLARVQAYPIADRWESRDRMFRRALARYDGGVFTGSYSADVARAGVLAHASHV